MAFSIDDGWDNCGPVARAGNAAFGVYCRCGAWAARNSTDGHVPAEVALAYGSPELAKRLVDVGLWEAVGGGWSMPHYLERNESAERVRARRKAEAERKARYRDRKELSTRDKTRTRRGTPAGQDAGIRASFTPPKGGKAARASDALPKPHPYDDDGHGNCRHCPLPKINVKVHRAA